MNNIEQNDTIDIKQEFHKYLRRWRLFALGVFLSLIIGWLYLRYATPMYKVDATIMIKDNKQAGISTELAAFEDLGILGGSSNNPENEIEVLKSRKIIGKAIDTLKLTTSYYREGRIRTVELYGDSNPIVFNWVQKQPNWIEKDTSFSISILDENSYHLKNADKTVVEKFNFNEAVETELGVFEVQLNTLFIPKEEFDEVFVNVIAKNELVDYYLQALNITAIEDLSPVLKLNLVTNIRQKGQDFIDELINQYNIDGINDENQVSQKTLNFIDERLVTIGNSLKEVQDNVKTYKTENNIP